jgi:hypothetical protein
VTKPSQTWPRPWRAARPMPPFAPPAAREQSEILRLLATSPRIPADQAMHDGAALLAVQLVRGNPAAIALSDQFADAGVRLPLLNWPKSALQPHEVSA